MKNFNKDLLVVLASNSSHYKHAAMAYQKNKILKYFLTTIFFKERYIYKIFPRIDKLFNSRYLNGLNPKLVKSLYSSELKSIYMKHFSKTSISEYYRINNEHFGKKVYKKLLNKNFDIFHFVSGLGLESITYAKSIGAKVICDQRGAHFFHEISQIMNEFNSTGKYWLHPESAFTDRLMSEYDQSDYIIVNSNYTKSSFINAGFNKNKIKVINLGVDNDLFSPRLQKSTKIFKLIFIGSIYPAKGIEYLLRAWEKLSLPESELVIIGGEDKYFNINKIKDVKLLPHLSHLEINRVLKESRIMVLPSIDESFGLVGLEGMSSGLPLITTNNCGVSEIIIDGYNGYTVPARNVEKLAAKIKLLYDDRKLLSEMSKNARATAIEYSWDSYGDKLVEYVKMVHS